MEIRSLHADEREAALALIWETFLRFEAPDYVPEGVRAFRAFIDAPEQIDALEIMGVNSASYLILPKIVAAVCFFPFLTILSILIGILGGWAISALTGIMIPADYVEGLLMDFKPYSIVYSLIKTAVFAYIIASISAYFGYYAKGNSLEVGRASTRAVVACSIVIMIFNLILTQILLI